MSRSAKGSRQGIVALLLISASACSFNEPPTTPAVTFTELGTLDAGGGIVENTRLGLRIEAPDGAFPRAVTLLVRQLAYGETPGRQTLALTPTAYQIRARDDAGRWISPSVPVSVQITYDPAAIPATKAAGDLALLTFDSTLSAWVPVVSTRNQRTTSVQAQLRKIGLVASGYVSGCPFAAEDCQQCGRDADVLLGADGPTCVCRSGFCTTDGLCTVGVPLFPDTDGDGFGDSAFEQVQCPGPGFVDVPGDNCPELASENLTDTDSDGLGDPCDLDDDNDGIDDVDDNCRIQANPNQLNHDDDMLGDACDVDDDDDQVLDESDLCPLVPDPEQTDLDGDQVGDACDDDLDGDEIVNLLDNCLLLVNADQTDTDADGAGDVCDADDDNDGILDANDLCPFVVTSTVAVDTDGDGDGDACDDDDDDDGLQDAADNCVLVSNADQADNEGDGVGDLCDADDDNDGVLDIAPDNCPRTPNPGQTDTDGDGDGNLCDPDDDDDRQLDGIDNCPVDANPGQENADSDAAGDACDLDDDNDGILDPADNCPLVSNADQSNVDLGDRGDACDPDDDDDGELDDDDNCRLVANADQLDTDSDQAGNACDLDDDDDGVADLDSGGNALDNCPLLVNPGQTDGDGDGVGDVCDLCAGDDALGDPDGNGVCDCQPVVEVEAFLVADCNDAAGDQTCLGQTTLLDDDERVGQMFTVSESGTLSGIDLPLYRAGDGTSTAQIRIFATASGLPLDDTPLASADVAVGADSGEGTSTTFSEEVELVAGTVYAITVEVLDITGCTADCVVNWDRASFVASADDPHEAGTSADYSGSWASAALRDQYFSIDVTTFPCD